MIHFFTSNLNVLEKKTENATPLFLKEITSMLCAEVVKDLPSYFQGITRLSLAQNWLDRVQQDSRLLHVYEQDSGVLVGFVILSDTDAGESHLGYILKETVWGRGYASEILFGLISSLKQSGGIEAVNAGVSESNVASIRLLEKSGFRLLRQEKGVLFYQKLIINESAK